MSLIKVEEVQKYIKRVTLNDSSTSNALSLEMIAELIKTLKKLDEDSQTRVIILTGEGKNFSSGGDVKKMKSKQDMFSGSANELRLNYQKGIQQIPHIIEQMQTPMLAMINGAAVGAGCDLACMCDMRIGSEKARIGHTFSRLNLVPGDGGTYFLPRIVGYAKAMEMTLTSKIYSATECLDMGLLNFIYGQDELEKEVMDLAQHISTLAPMALGMTKKALRNSVHGSLQSQLDLLSAFQGIAQTANDHQEGLDAFFEKRSPDFSNT